MDQVRSRVAMIKQLLDELQALALAGRTKRRYRHKVKKN